MIMILFLCKKQLTFTMWLRFLFFCCLKLFSTPVLSNKIDGNKLSTRLSVDLSGFNLRNCTLVFSNFWSQSSFGTSPIKSIPQIASQLVRWLVSQFLCCNSVLVVTDMSSKPFHRFLELCIMPVTSGTKTKKFYHICKILRRHTIKNLPVQTSLNFCTLYSINCPNI